MGIFVFSCFLFSYLSYHSKKNKEDSPVWCSIGIIFSIIYIFMFVSLYSTNIKNQIKIQEYYALRQAIDYARVKDLSSFERIKVIDSINEMNNTIAKHRIKHDSFIYGLWNSKEIANLEYLK